MKRSPIVRKTPLARGSSTLERSTFKRKAPKKRPGHDKTMRDACRDQDCYLAVAGICRGDTATTVPCHPNWSDYGKGMGLKADDRFVVPGCFSCHAWLDQGPAPRDEKRQVFERALRRWKAYRERSEAA